MRRFSHVDLTSLRLLFKSIIGQIHSVPFLLKYASFVLFYSLFEKFQILKYIDF